MTAGARKQRLQRLDRIFVRTPIYFVTMCANNRRPILADEFVHEAFVRFAEQGMESRRSCRGMIVNDAPTIRCVAADQSETAVRVIVGAF